MRDGYNSFVIIYKLWETCTLLYRVTLETRLSYNTFMWKERKLMRGNVGVILCQIDHFLHSMSGSLIKRT